MLSIRISELNLIIMIVSSAACLCFRSALPLMKFKFSNFTNRRFSQFSNVFSAVFFCPAYVSEALRADKNEMKKNYLASGRTGLAGHNYEL